MSSRSQLAACLALAGGAIAACSMLLHWYTWDMQGMEDLARRLLPSQALSGLSKSQLDAMLKIGVESAPAPSHLFTGYRVFRPLSVGLHELWAVLALSAGWRVLSGQAQLNTQRRAFAIAAVFLTIRPILALTRNPGSDAFADHGFSNVHIVAPTYGVWVAIVGALLVGVAAYLAFTAETWVAAHDQVEFPDGSPAGPFVPAGAAPAPTPYMPGGPAPAAAAGPAPLFMSAGGPSMSGAGPIPMPGAPAPPSGAMLSQAAVPVQQRPAALTPASPTDHSIYMTSNQGTPGGPNPVRPSTPAAPGPVPEYLPAPPSEPEAYGLAGPVAPAAPAPSPHHAPSHGAAHPPAAPGPYIPSVPAHIAADPVAPSPPKPLPPYVAGASNPAPGRPTHGHGNTPEGAFLPMPVVHDDGGAYGAEGPSSLDAQARRAPRGDDPYAPKRAAPAPHLAVAPAPAPTHAPPPAPAAAAPAPAAPSRQGSVAPPGMG